MKNLSVFNFITLNGYVNATNGDISWHRHGTDENQFASNSLKSGNTLLFGRKTYDLMAAYWPTPMAMQNDPDVAEGMNNANKIVISRTIKKALWKNTVVIDGDVVSEIKKMKKIPGSDITVLGSGSIVTLLAENNLIDDFQIMIDPVAIASGNPIFGGITRTLNFKLEQVKTFKSGVVLLIYKPL